MCTLVNLQNSKNARRLVTMLVPMLGWGHMWWMGARQHNGRTLCPLDMVTDGYRMGLSTIVDNNETTTTDLVTTTTDVDPGMGHGLAGLDDMEHLAMVVVATTPMDTLPAQTVNTTTSTHNMAQKDQ